MTMNAQEKLWAAAAKGDQGMIRALVFEDIDFDARDDQDRTAFNIATQYGHSAAAQTILAAKNMKEMQRMGLTSPQFENVTRTQNDQRNRASS